MNRYVMLFLTLLLLAACSLAETHNSGNVEIELDDLTIEISDYEMKSSNDPDEEQRANPFLEVYIEAEDDLMELMQPNPFDMNHSNMWGGIGKTQMYLNPDEPGEYELAYIIQENQDTTVVMDQAYKAEVVILSTDSNGDSEELKRIHLETK